MTGRTATRRRSGRASYDIHSPRVPPAAEMLELLEAAAKVLDPEQIWVNPDCGLKTRTWDEVEPAPAEHGAGRRGSFARSSGDYLGRLCSPPESLPTLYPAVARPLLR